MTSSTKAATASSTISTSWRNDAPLAIRKIDTSEAARRLHVRPQSMRRALCVVGSYLGLTPVKLPNGRLMWDSAQIDALFDGEVAQ